MNESEDSLPTLESTHEPEPVYVAEPVPMSELPSQTTLGPAPRSAALDMGGLRIIIIGWCVWLLGSWAVAWTNDTGIPRARWMLIAAVLGMMLGWPAVRLSQSHNPSEPGRGALQILLDWFCMICIFQAVLWSLHLLAAWPLIRGLWLNIAVVSWSLLAGAIVGWARLFDLGPMRLLGMAMCIALVTAEPLVLWMMGIYPGSDEWILQISPLQAIWELSVPPNRAVANDWPPRIILIGLIALSAWSALIGWRVIERVFLRGIGRVDQGVDETREG